MEPLLARFAIREVIEVAGQLPVVVGRWRSGGVQEGARVGVGCGGLLCVPVVVSRVSSRQVAQGDEEVTITFELAGSLDPEEASFMQSILETLCTQGSTIGLMRDDDGAS